MNLRVSSAAAVLALGVALLPTGVRAAEGEVQLKEMSWPSHGIFGSFDRAAVQRGFQVYREVCASCHGLSYVSFRTLADLGYPEEQVEAIAAEYTVTGEPDDAGEIVERPAIPADYVPSPYPNEQAAAAANGGKAPPDLSLITKAREGHEDYIHSLLTGYTDPPEGVEVPEGSYYNAVYPGGVIAMPQPLSDDQVSYADGTAATVDQMSSDVTQFLSWAAEPKLEVRKQTGLKVMLFLVVLTGLTLALKRKVWADVAH